MFCINFHRAIPGIDRSNASCASSISRRRPLWLSICVGTRKNVRNLSQIEYPIWLFQLSPLQDRMCAIIPAVENRLPSLVPSRSTSVPTMDTSRSSAPTASVPSPNRQTSLNMYVIFFLPRCPSSHAYFSSCFFRSFSFSFWKIVANTYWCTTI